MLQIKILRFCYGKYRFVMRARIAYRFSEFPFSLIKFTEAIIFATLIRWSFPTHMDAGYERLLTA